MSGWLAVATTFLGAGSIGIAIQLYRLIKEYRKESVGRKEELEIRHIESYRELDTKYLRFLEMCLEYPEAFAYISQRDAPTDEMSPEMVVKRTIIYEYIVSIAESAFIYKDRNKLTLERSWPLWESFLKKYKSRRSFEEFIKQSIADDEFAFNPDFRSYLLDLKV